MDSYSIQVDVYAATATLARNAAGAIRDAVEPVAHVTSWGGESRDPDTNNYRVNFTIDWWVPRPLVVVGSGGVLAQISTTASTAVVVVKVFEAGVFEEGVFE